MAQTQTAPGVVAGYFEDHADAERAVHNLREAGFTSAHIGVAHATGTASNTTSHAASAVGEKAEGVWDKVKNFFDGGDAEPYSDERSQGELANREVTPNPADSYRSASSSDLHGSLTGLSMPENQSRYFGKRFGANSNGALVTVNANGRSSEAESILTRAGADLGNNAGEYNDSDDVATLQGSQDTSNLQGTQNIQLLGEMLRVHKDRVSRGEVTLRKEIITENQTIQVPVTREELVIERRAVSGDASVHGNIGDNNEIRIPLTEEIASVDKSTVVREEVSVGKRNVEEVRNLSSEVRHEELAIDDEKVAKVGDRF